MQTNTKKIIAIFILISSFFGFTNKTYAIGDEFANFLTSVNTYISAGRDVASGILESEQKADTILKKVAQGVAIKLLNNLTQTTINWVNSGYEDWGGGSGESFYLKDPNSFFKNIANKEVNKIVDEIAYDTEKNPYGASIAVDIINASNRNFSDDFQFTLDKSIGDNWQEFENDFGVGGWNGYLEFVTNPANNPVGAALMVNEELNTRKSTEEANIERELSNSDGGGFLSMKECVEWTEGYTPEGTEGYTFDVLSTFGTNDNCKRYETKTPGSVISAKVTQAITSDIRQNELSAAFGNSISAIFTTLFDNLISQGLSYIGSSITNQNTSTYYGSTVAAISDSTYGTSGADNEVNLTELLITGPVDPETGLADSSKTIVALTQKDIQEKTEIYSKTKTLPSKLQILDSCLPGPDYGWEKRFSDIVRKETGKFERKALNAVLDSNQDEAQEALYQVNGKTALIIPQINLRKIDPYTNIPSAGSMYSIISSSVKDISVQDDILDEVSKKAEALAALTGLVNEYIFLGGTTSTEITEEKNQLAAKYLALEPKLSNESALADTEIKLEILDEKIDYLDELYNTCLTEKNTQPIMFDGNGDIDVGYDGVVDTQIDVNFNGTIDGDGNIYTVITGGFIPESEGSLYPINILNRTGTYFERTQDNDSGTSSGPSMSFTKEMWFYCAQPMDLNFNVSNIYKNDDVIVNCNDFYNSSIYDYYPQRTY